MKYLLASVGSCVLTMGVVMNAYYQKKQFYPSVVYITKSSPSMAVLYVQAFVFVVLMGKLIRKVFFGQLRPAEMEHLIERSWYAVTETCLAFTVFRDDFSPRFVALFTLLLFLKCFHWLAEDRVDYMERSPVISLLFHFRATSLLMVLAMVDLFFVNHAYYSTLLKGASVQLVFGFEYAILLTVVVHIFVKYILHTVDLQSENPWENKAVYLLYAEVNLGFIKVVLYCIFLLIMIKVHTFPLFAIRPMYLTIRTFKKALSDVIMSRRAIRNMNNLYPDATPDELAQDDVCIICREQMQQACKKLPCNHVFHASCLRSWFQRQQTCPTCRMDVLRPPPPRARPAAAQPQQPPHAPPVMPGFPPGFPMWPPQQPVPAAAAPAVSSSSTSAGSATAPPGTSSATLPVPPPAMNPFMMPPFFMPMPFTVPPPMPGPDFSGLTDDELRLMEGQTREGVEARVQCLRNIQTLLDAAVLQMQQYSTLVQSLGSQTPTRQHSDNTTVTTSTKTRPSPVEVTHNGAKPKTSQSKTDTVDNLSPETSQQHVSSPKQEEESILEGATGYTPPGDESIPEWVNFREENSDNSELNEVRRRRIERFSSTNLESLDTEQLNIKSDDSS